MELAGGMSEYITVNVAPASHKFALMLHAVKFLDLF